jgi:hypothetical protein
MHRVSGLILAGLGTFLIAVAVLLPTYVSGQVVKFPLSEYETATLAGTGMTYFSPSKLTEETNVSMRATYTIKGDATAGNSSTAVWNEFSYVYDATNNLTDSYTTRRFAFDRRTAQLVDCCGANVNGDTGIRQTGTLGYVFPIGTQKKNYDVFDTSLNKPVPFIYSGTADTSGIQTYVFKETVAPTQISTLSVPGSFVGINQATVTLPEFYQIHLIYYVDPETGALVNVNEDQEQTLRNPSTGQTALVLFDGDLVATPATVAAVIKLDTKGRNELSLLNTTLPLVVGIVGVIALIAGIFLARRRREDLEAGLHGTSPESAAEAAEAPEAAETPEAAEAPETAAPALAADPEVVPGLKDETAEPSEETEPAKEAPADAPAEAPNGEAPKAGAPAEPQTQETETVKSEAAKTEAE